MNRRLSDWASIAEIVSGIAVVVTLSTKSARMGFQSTLTPDFNEFIAATCAERQP